MRGLLVTFEGGEGSGKGTAAGALVEMLREKGFSATLFREPGSAEIAEEIRKVIQKPRNRDKITPVTELFLFEAARSQFVSEMLLPALEENDVVVLDRFYDSTTVYQGDARGIDKELISRLNSVAASGLVPDMTFILDVTPEVGLLRCEKKEFGTEGDRLEQESLEFHYTIRQGYLDLAKTSSRFIVIDTEKNDGDEVLGIALSRVLEKAEKIRKK